MSEADSEHLDPSAAAHHLGITPELLFAYTRSRFRGPGGSRRRLAVVDIKGKTRFARVELDAFDEYLWGSWANKTDPRPDPPKAILDHLRAEAGNQCLRCGSGIGIHTAHIIPWAESRCHHPHNLIRLCSACHVEHDEHNSVTTEELRALKARAIAGTRAMLERRMAGAVISSQRPPADPLFIGRTTDLIIVRTALRTSRTVLILGAGGIGKTQLLLHALAEVDTGRPVLWLDVERFGGIQGVLATLYMLASTGPQGEDLPSLARRLDGLSACVVLDGLEQLRGPNLEAVDDLLAELQLLTSDTQFVITSQVDLARTRCEARLRIGGLGEEAGRDVLRALIAAQVPVDPKSEKGLLDFCEGHPLALRLASALAAYFGSGAVALERISQRGTAAVELQKRSKHDRRASLGICLSLAYDALESDERRLLFLLANAPGGLFVLGLEAGHFGFDAIAAAAGLRRWCLVNSSDPGEARERLYTLAPIASYADRRWRDENAEYVAQILVELCRNLAVMAAVISERADDPAEVPYMLARYAEELPNFLRVFDAAERYPENAELALLTAGLCVSLMRFFFIRRLPEQGAALMRRGAELALRDGEMKRAAGMIVQMVALAHRSDDENLRRTAELLVDRLDDSFADSATKGNISLCRAMIAFKAGCLDDSVCLAKDAIGRFEAALRDRIESAENPADEGADELHNYLSSAHGLLGNALLARGEPEAAREAYQAAHDLLRGGAVAVNVGQYLHQIGNCESHLGRHAEAAHCYREAAIHFHAIGMKEYLSNALGELGFTLTDQGIDAQPPVLPDELLIEALEDVAEDVRRAFTAAPMPHHLCASMLRKLFGVIVVVSLTAQARAVVALSNHLAKTLLPGAGGATPPTDHNEWFAYAQLANILGLADTIGAFDACAMSDREIELLAIRCFQQDTWIDLRRRSFVWLEMYLRMKCAISDVTADELMSASLIAQGGAPFRVRPQ